MKLAIDTRNGLAGDIVAAGLIGLGADSARVREAMMIAGRLLGETDVQHIVEDGINRLLVQIEGRPDHLSASLAMEYLGMAVEEADIGIPWTDTALKTLRALVDAEAHVHSSHSLLCKHFHGEAVLHEAADIIIDVMGMAAGMQALGITHVQFIDYVNVGSGTVQFSHGTLDVPTPATKHILDSFRIPWRKTDSGMEMTTPTGASILAGCEAVRIDAEPPFAKKAMAGGTRPLPPITFYLLE